jgi:zinc/manganese transport system permease protein
LIGATIFSLTGKRSSQIPQEAVIGISYVVAAAAAVLLLSRAAEGDEGNQEHAGWQYSARNAA